MQLRDYMKSREITDEAAASQLNVSRATVTRWRNGAMRPDWGTMSHIQEWSEQKVRPNDWAKTTRTNKRAVKKKT